MEDSRCSRFSIVVSVCHVKEKYSLQMMTSQYGGQRKLAFFALSRANSSVSDFSFMGSVLPMLGYKMTGRYAFFTQMRCDRNDVTASGKKRRKSHQQIASRGEPNRSRKRHGCGYVSNLWPLEAFSSQWKHSRCSQNWQISYDVITPRSAYSG